MLEGTNGSLSEEILEKRGGKWTNQLWKKNTEPREGIRGAETGKLEEPTVKIKQKVN
jgi:hypothetical protein